MFDQKNKRNMVRYRLNTHFKKSWEDTLSTAQGLPNTPTPKFISSNGVMVPYRSNKKSMMKRKKNAVNTHFLTKYRNYPILSRLIRTKILTIPCFYFINVKWNIANGLSFVLTLTTRDVTANNQNGAPCHFEVSLCYVFVLTQYLLARVENPPQPNRIRS